MGGVGGLELTQWRGVSRGLALINQNGIDRWRPLIHPLRWALVMCLTSEEEEHGQEDEEMV